MFDDKIIALTSFKSRWKEKRNTSNSETQTDFNETSIDSSSQAFSTCDEEVQTECIKVPVSAVSYCEKNLIAFFQKVSPHIFQALDENETVSVNLSEPIIEENMLDFEMQCLFKAQIKMPVSSISWNCDGSIIAVGHRCHHENWCRHEGTIQLLSFNDYSESSTKQSVQTLKVKNCVSSVKMHPTKRFLLAAGTVSGDVYLWMFRKDVNSHVLSTHHSDCITDLSWIVISADPKLTLATSSKDSLLILWDVSLQSNSINPGIRFMFGDVLNPGVEPGINCFAFSSSQQDGFVVALANGTLLKCSVVAARPLPQTKGRKMLMHNPVVGKFQGSTNPVTSLDFQKSNEDIFLALSLDQHCFMYSFSDCQPLKVIICDQDIFGIKWYPSSSNHILTWGENAVSLYDMNSASIKSSLKPFQREVDTTTVTTTSFNHTCHSSLIAAFGSFDGKVAVWKIPKNIDQGENFFS